MLERSRVAHSYQHVLQSNELCNNNSTLVAETMTGIFNFICGYMTTRNAQFDAVHSGAYVECLSLSY